MSTGAVFANFQDKAELFEAVLGEEMETAAATLRAGAQVEGPVQTRLVAALSAGYEILNFPDEEACEFAAAQVAKEGLSLVGGKDWAACLRMAERLYPEFRE